MCFLLNIQPEAAYIAAMNSQINIACAVEVLSCSGAKKDHFL